VTTTNDIVRRFTYHAPTPAQVPKYEEIRDRARDFALFLHETCPGGPELDEAINHVDLAVMRANASIARRS